AGLRHLLVSKESKRCLLYRVMGGIEIDSPWNRTHGITSDPQIRRVLARPMLNCILGRLDYARRGRLHDLHRLARCLLENASFDVPRQVKLDNGSLPTSRGENAGRETDA